MYHIQEIKKKSLIGTLFEVIFTSIAGIVFIGYMLYMGFNISNTANASTINQTDIRIEMLEKSVKDLQEKNDELEERLNYMGDSLGTTIELVDRLEAKVGM